MNERKEVVDHAAVVMKRNRAWLISISDIEGDATPDELYDCASNLVVAKRVARKMVDSFGYIAPFRWRFEQGIWWLSATYEFEGYDITDTPGDDIE